MEEKECQNRTQGLSNQQDSIQLQRPFAVSALLERIDCLLLVLGPRSLYLIEALVFHLPYPSGISASVHAEAECLVEVLGDAESYHHYGQCPSHHST